ncbi:MAG: PorT family protein [Bacteroidales bacterium]|nr:PorT family protein [Bacteroidales bacterium]
MKKSLFTMALLLILIQPTVYSQAKPFRFGLRVAPTVDWLSPSSEGYENDGAAFGFNWGFMSDITLTDNYYFSTGFGIQHFNGKLQFEYQEVLDGNTEPTSGMLSRKYILRYVEVPLLIKMKTNKFDNIQYFGQIGFGLGLNVKATAKDTFTYSGGSSTGESDISDEIVFLRGSWALGGGLEYYLDESTSLLVGLTFSNGISNILKDNNPVTGIEQKAVPNYFELTLGIFF